MNRNNEFAAMMEELNQPVPQLKSTLDRAVQKRKKRVRQLVVAPLAGFAVCFVVFVLLVNFCAPVAYACSLVPGLRELAEAVTFSQSLTDAVENEYVQPMNLTQTANGITAEIAYLIVDQKQVNVFYRLDSKEYEELYADPDVLSADGTGYESCSYHSSGFNAENGELRCLTIDFIENDVPGALMINLRVRSNGVVHETVPEEGIEDIYADDIYVEPDCLAELEFLLEFDPKFTATGKTFPVNQTVILDGQAITITDIEVYPTHMRVDIGESADNTAWLKKLDFYIETDMGMIFDPISNGITATGSGDSPSMVSYRADSTYFYEAESLKLVITGAQWLRKDMETTYLNLVTGEHGELPEGAAFVSATKQGGYWVIKFRAAYEEDKPMYQLFGHLFYDVDGTEYEINQWSSMYGDPNEEGNITYFYDEFPLKNFDGEEVWLKPHYSYNWVAENQIIIHIH